MLVTVGRYLDPWEARILRARLEAEHIPASIAGDHHAIASWHLEVALGGVLLQVPLEHAGRAQQVLAAYDSGELERDLLAEHPDAEERCPNCGSTRLERRAAPASRVAAILLMLLAGIPSPVKAFRMHCAACGHAWWPHAGAPVRPAGTRARRV